MFLANIKPSLLRDRPANLLPVWEPNCTTTETTSKGTKETFGKKETNSGGIWGHFCHWIMKHISVETQWNTSFLVPLKIRFLWDERAAGVIRSVFPRTANAIWVCGYSKLHTRWKVLTHTDLPQTIPRKTLVHRPARQLLHSHTRTHTHKCTQKMNLMLSLPSKPSVSGGRRQFKAIAKVREEKNK